MSARSFLSVASLSSSSLHASLSTFRFSFSNSSGVKARVLASDSEELVEEQLAVGSQLQGE